MGLPRADPVTSVGLRYKAGKGAALFQKVVNEQGLARRSESPTPGGTAQGRGQEGDGRLEAVMGLPP